MFRDDLILFLFGIYNKEETNKLLDELDSKEIIKIEYDQIYPVSELDDEWYDFNIQESGWSEYYPDLIDSNLSKNQNLLKNQIKENYFKNKYGYFEKDQDSHYNKVKEYIKNLKEIGNSDLKMYPEKEVSFQSFETYKTKDGVFGVPSYRIDELRSKFDKIEKIGNRINLRVLRNNVDPDVINYWKEEGINDTTYLIDWDGEPVNGIVFSLSEGFLNHKNGQLDFLTSYKYGIKNGVQISFNQDLQVKELWIYKDGIEIERKEFDDNGEIIQNRESICFVERNKLEKSNLCIFAHTTTKYLNWVVKDMSTGEYVFTSDSDSECEQWIETGDLGYDK